MGATANPIRVRHYDEAVTVFADIPPLRRYQDGLHNSTGVTHVRQGGG